MFILKTLSLANRSIDVIELNCDGGMESRGRRHHHPLTSKMGEADMSMW